MTNSVLINKFRACFNSEKVLIGMIHIEALPGTPKHKLEPKKIISNAITEAKIYEQAGIKSVIIENMHDIPYLKSAVGHEISTLMAIIGYEIKKQVNLKCGIQILAGANKEALAAAHSANLDFVRAEGFVFGHLADEGFIESQAAELLRYRKLIGAENIMIFTDIKKKHSSHAISNDTTVEEHAHAAQFFLSDGVIITGKSTGMQTDKQELIRVKQNCSLPIIVGSGINADNITDYFPLADGFIVGSYFKIDGKWQNPPDKERIKKLLEKIPEL